MDFTNTINNVKSKEDFVSFAELLAQDYKENLQKWEK